MPPHIKLDILSRLSINFMPARDKHSGLFFSFVSDIIKKFYNTDNWLLASPIISITSLHLPFTPGIKTFFFVTDGGARLVFRLAPNTRLA